MPRHSRNRSTPSLILAITALLLLTASTSAAHFADFNTLHAFIPATSSEELAFLSFDRTAANLTDADSDTASKSLHDLSPQARQARHHTGEDLLRRDGACGSYNSCSNQGAPSLCCAPQRVCSADALGRVGCCPVGAACTGTIPGAGGVVAGATSTSFTQAGGYTMTATAVTTTAAAATTSQQTQGGFVIAGSSTVAVLGQGMSTGGAGAVGVPSVFRILTALLRMPAATYALAIGV